MDFDQAALLALMSEAASDPIIERVKQEFFKDATLPPIEVIGEQDYERIGLPLALHPSTKGKVGFRVYKGATPQPNIYVNKHSKLYQDALRAQDSFPRLLLAGHLVHENAHSNSLDEREAYSREVEFLSPYLSKLSSNQHQREQLQRYIEQLTQRTRK